MQHPMSKILSRPSKLRASAFIAVLILALPTTLKAQATPFQPATTKGTNYFANLTLAIDNVLGSLPATGGALLGQFSPAIINAEIGRIAASGLTSIRFFPSFFGWIADKNAYMASLAQFAAICNQHNIKITYVVWSAIGLSRPALSSDGVISTELWHELAGTNPTDPTNVQVYNGALFRAILLNQEFVNFQGVLPPGEPYFFGVHHDPGNELIAMSGDYNTWPFGLAARVDEYLDAIASFFSSDPVGMQAFGSYDLFNEPNGGAAVNNIPLANYLTFIQTTYNALHNVHPGAHYTVGWAGSDEIVDAHEQTLLNMGVATTYYSVHSYAGGDIFDRDLSARSATAVARGVPLVCSEFYRTDFTAGTLKYQLATLDRLGAGGQMWGFIQGNTFNNFAPFGTYALDGIYIPVPDPTGPSPVAFFPNNLADRAAVEAWTAGTLAVGPYSRIRFPAAPGVLPNQDSALPVGANHVLQVSSTLVGQPALLLQTLVNPISLPCQLGDYVSCGIIPGLGPLLLLPQTQAIPLGVIPPSQALATPIFFPPQWSGLAISFQAYVGTYPHHNFTQNTGELTEGLLVYPF